MKKKKKSVFIFKQPVQTSLNFLIGSIILGLTCFIIFVSAAPPTSPYSPGATLTPDCSPGDPNCTVYAPLATALTADTSVIMSDYALNFDSGTLYVDALNNRVGIGTTSPYAKLAVAGQVVAEYFTATSTSATSTLSWLTATRSDLGTIIAGIWNGSSLADAYLDNNITINGGAISGTTNIISLGSDATGDIYYRNSSGYLARLAIGTGGYVIGSVSGIPGWVATTTLATISGTLANIQGGTGQDSSAWNGPISVANGVWTATTSIGVQYGGTGLTAAAAGYALIGNSSTALQATSSLFISTAGNVGIGTTTPNWKFQAAGTRPFFALSDTGASANLKHWFLSSQGGNFYIGTSSDAYATSTISAITLTPNGYFGIATTSPAVSLAVNGQCVTGDTELSVVKPKVMANDKFPISNEIQKIQIKDVKGGEMVLSLNEKTGKLEPARIKGLLDMGIKPIYKITTEDGKTIRTTANHPYLTRVENNQLLNFTRMMEKGQIRHYQQEDSIQYKDKLVSFATGGNEINDNNKYSDDNVENKEIIHSFELGVNLRPKINSSAEVNKPASKVIRSAWPPMLAGKKNPMALEAINNEEKLFVPVSQNSGQSHQDEAQNNYGQSKVDDIHIDSNYKFLDSQRLKIQQNKVTAKPVKNEEKLILSKIAGKTTDANATRPVSEAISESLFNWPFDNFSMQFNYDGNNNYSNSNHDLSNSNNNSKQQKTTSINEMAFVASTGARSELVNPVSSISEIKYLSSADKNSLKAVEMGGVEPPRLELTSSASQPAIPTADLLYQEKINQAKWTKVSELSAGDEIAVAREDLENIKFSKIIKIEHLPAEQVYDIEVQGTHNFIGNDIVAHNTYITGGLGVGQVETTAGNITGTGRLAITGASATSTFSTGGLTVGTNQFVVQQTSGNIGIGTTNPLYKLEVNGSASTTNLYLPQTGAGVGVIYSGTTPFIHNYGTESTFIGIGAGNLTFTGTRNSAIGTNALPAVTSGGYNIAMGSYALNAVTTGSSNLGIGYAALLLNNSDNNVAIGSIALYTATGNQNTAVGSQAGSATGASFSNNSLFGYRSGLNLTSGSNNVLLGKDAGLNLTTGANNIIIGYQLNAPAVDSSNYLSIGNVIYGNLSTGNVGIGTTSPPYKLSIQSTSEGDMFQLYDTDGNCRLDPDSGGLTTTCSSDTRLKTDITPAASVLSYLNGLPIKDYTVIASGDRRTGVVAQELLAAGYTDLVSLGQDGYYGVKEISSWKIIKAAQEIDAKVGALGSGFHITNSQGQAIFSKSRDIDPLPNRDMAITAENILLNGNVGIGTTTPSSSPLSGGGQAGGGFKLDVAGNINTVGLCLNGNCINSWSELTAVFSNNNLQIDNSLSIRPEQVFALDADGYLIMGKINAQAVKTKFLSMDNTGAAGAKMIGGGVIEIGSTTATILNQDLATTSKIFITWRENLNGANWWICNQVSDQSFSVCLDRPAATSTPFDYWIVGVSENPNSQLENTPLPSQAPSETFAPAPGQAVPPALETPASNTQTETAPAEIQPPLPPLSGGSESAPPEAAIDSEKAVPPVEPIVSAEAVPAPMAEVAPAN